MRIHADPDPDPKPCFNTDASVILIGQWFEVKYLFLFNNKNFPPDFEMFKTVFRIRIHFFRIRIRIQRLRLETNTDPDPGPIRIQGFNDQKLKKNNS
jgi:hypothetical protein